MNLRDSGHSVSSYATASMTHIISAFSRQQLHQVSMHEDLHRNTFMGRGSQSKKRNTETSVDHINTALNIDRTPHTNSNNAGDDL